MKVFITSTCLALGFAGSAMAQDAVSLCHHAGLTYSPGSMITMGQSLQRCAVTESGTSIWTVAPDGEKEDISANCVSGGREFGHGSILNAGAANLLCRGGIWYVRKEE